jgi:hypothetical protein
MAGTPLLLLCTWAYEAGERSPTILRYFEGHKPSICDVACVSAMEYALHSDEFNAAIFIGDSTCHDGIDPVEFERRTGRSAYNLGSDVALGPEGYYLTLRAYLENHNAGPFMGVILCLTPFAFERAQDAGAVREFCERYRTSIPGELPIYKRVGATIRYGARSMLAKPSPDPRDLPLELCDTGETYRSMERTAARTRGWGRLHTKHGGGPIPRDERWGSPVGIGSYWDHWVHRIADLCADHSLILRIRFTPLAKNDRAARDWAPLLRWVEDFRKQRSVVVMSPTLVWVDGELMWDGLHLNEAGAHEFTSLVARDLPASGAAKFTAQLAKDVEAALGE